MNDDEKVFIFIASSRDIEPIHSSMIDATQMLHILKTPLPLKPAITIYQKSRTYAYLFWAGPGGIIIEKNLHVMITLLKRMKNEEVFFAPLGERRGWAQICYIKKRLQIFHLFFSSSGSHCRCIR